MSGIGIGDQWIDKTDRRPPAYWRRIKLTLSLLHESITAYPQ